MVHERCTEQPDDRTTRSVIGDSAGQGTQAHLGPVPNPADGHDAIDGNST
eukprot:CAMPEP_0182562170 /NCGR_PEP_ID=MMETSP1324-20130603/4546_1 /TAXON_ID=236786 /ORGANISM="Florenciella sp., Strain RCC1587" /LENGTH=49 /DNA_ID= /DNA_START= /DNA_END= /DNA_ORIENTATION=